MARPGHRLDLLLVPPDPDARPVEALNALLRELKQRGVVGAAGQPGPEAARWVEGGFARLRVDKPDRITLYANAQGGFRVRCPTCGANLVPTFSAALTAWRSGGPRRCTCPSCGADPPLEALDFQPPAAFGRVALVTHDAGGSALTGEAQALVQQHLGPWRQVLSRTQ